MINSQQYILEDEIKINRKSLVVENLLNWRKVKVGGWEKAVEDGFEILRQGERVIFLGERFIVARGFWEDKEIDYVEAIPWKEPTAKDAIEHLSSLQKKIVDMSNKKEVDFVVNLWGVVGGLRVSWQFKRVIDLIKKEKFKREWIVIKEREFVFFDNHEDWEVVEFPISVLKLFAEKKFPGKFKIVNSFGDVLVDLTNE